MRVAAFHYELPGELIAQYPLERRSASRLLCVDGASGALADRQFTDVESMLVAGDLLVLNDTRVIKARLHATKPSGGRVEVLIERVLGRQRACAFLRAGGRLRPGAVLRFEGGCAARVRPGANGLFELSFDGPLSVEMLTERFGHVPLPPYIKRRDEPFDVERYQTVYARCSGAVAAPTAGLHFDSALLSRLAGRGVESVAITLHVGAGTFQPVRVSEVEHHVMHAERVQISRRARERVAAARGRGARVIAVGTTCVRALEMMAATSCSGDLRTQTDLFIYPGFGFRAVDALITNFHLPCSTLLMLVCAFGGTGNILAAYRHAVAARYRFHSYGDAMFVTRQSAGAV